MPRPLPALNLCADFHAIAEGKNHPSVRMYRCVIHHPVKQFLAEIHLPLPYFLKPRKESAEKVMLDFPPLPLLLQSVHPALQGGAAFCVPRVFPAVILLVELPGSVLVHQPLDHPRDYLHLSADFLRLTVDAAAVRQRIHDRPAVRDGRFPVFHQDAECLKEQLLYPLLVQAGRGAPALPFELGVALPDRPPVLAVGVPHLGAEVFSAVAAFQLCGEHAVAVMALPHVLPPLYLRLHDRPFLKLNNSVTAVLCIMLQHFPLVHLTLFLQESVTFVLFVGNDLLHHPSL